MSDESPPFHPFRSVLVHRAQRVPGRGDVEDVHIVVGGMGEFPTLPEKGEAAVVRDCDAGAILRALKSALPGGTFDRLCGLMMLDRASELVVSRESLAARDAELAARRSPPSPPPPAADDSGDFMTWRSLHRRLDELARRDDVHVREAMDHEVVVRIDEDGLVACCGGLSRVDVEVGIGEQPALVLDGATRIPCDDLVAFSNGQLSPVRSEQFRRHLSGCSACQDALAEQMQTIARLSEPGDSVGLREDHRSFLSSYVRSEERSLDPVRRMRGVVVGAALSAAMNGPRLVTEIARPLMALRRDWTRDPAPPVYADSLNALMEHLGLAVDDFWERRHFPVLVEVDVFPGVQIAGCTCDWTVPEGTADRAEAFDLHATNAWNDSLDVEIAAAQDDGGVGDEARAGGDR